MIIVQNRIRVEAGFRKEFEERFSRRQSNLKNFKGFVKNYVLKPTGKDDEYVVMTIWESRDAFETWTDSKEFKEAHNMPLPQGAILDRPILKIHEVINEI
ncbi:MAG: antibiotic biosynthesis monooxygenase family protein [Cuniculiplasma sp.]